MTIEFATLFNIFAAIVAVYGWMSLFADIGNSIMWTLGYAANKIDIDPEMRNDPGFEDEIMAIPFISVITWETVATMVATAYLVGQFLAK